MQSAKMTTWLTLFIVIATTSSFVAAAPTYTETVDENVGNLERGLAEDERQFADVAEQEVEPAEQQAAVAQPHCFRICVKWGRFGICARWDMRCRRTLNDGAAESANVQVAEDSVAEQEVQPVVQQGAAARPHCIRICVKWGPFGVCAQWGRRCWRSLDDAKAESAATVHGSEANLQQENVAEREVGPTQQDAAVARHVAFGCKMECKRKVWKGCIDWTWKCRRSLDNQKDATEIVSGSEVDQQADVAEPEVEPVVQEEAVAQSHCTKICIVRDYRGRCFRYYLKCPKRQ